MEKYPLKIKMWNLCAAGAVMALAGCGGQAPSDNAASSGAAPAAGATQLTGAGATFPAPIYSKWFGAYKEAKGVSVNYQPIGSGGGIQQLKNGTVDFGASDVALKDDDLKEMPGEVLHIPTVAGAVAVVYNLKGAPADLKLDGATVADIYLGKITKWNDPKIAGLNAGVALPETSIKTAHRADGSGTTNIFTSYLKIASPEWGTKVGSGKSVDWPAGGQGGKGNDGVTSIVKGADGGIGYVELAYAKQNKLAYASIKNKAGQFVAPSVAATTAAAQASIATISKDVRSPIINADGATSYPISGFTYVLVYKKQKDAEKGKALVDLLNWAVTDGQKSAESLDYAPLPAEVVKLNETAIKSIS